MSLGTSVYPRNQKVSWMEGGWGVGRTLVVESLLDFRSSKTATRYRSKNVIGISPPVLGTNSC